MSGVDKDGQYGRPLAGLISSQYFLLALLRTHGFVWILNPSPQLSCFLDPSGRKPRSFWSY